MRKIWFSLPRLVSLFVWSAVHADSTDAPRRAQVTQKQAEKPSCQSDATPAANGEGSAIYRV